MFLFGKYSARQHHRTLAGLDRGRRGAYRRAGRVRWLGSRAAVPAGAVDADFALFARRSTEAGRRGHHRLDDFCRDHRRRALQRRQAGLRRCRSRVDRQQPPFLICHVSFVFLAGIPHMSHEPQTRDRRTFPTSNLSDTFNITKNKWLFPVNYRQPRKFVVKS